MKPLFKAILDAYERDWKRHNDEYAQFSEDRRRDIALEKEGKPFDEPPRHRQFKGFQIDYSQFGAGCIHAAQKEFGFSEREAVFIMGVVYERYHSCYGEVIPQMNEFCQMFADFKLIQK